MELYYAFSVIIVLAALFSYVNVRYVKLPMTIGIMVIAMMVSVGIRLFGGAVFSDLAHKLEAFLPTFPTKSPAITIAKGDDTWEALAIKKPPITTARVTNTLTW